MNFCLDDGAELLEGPASLEPPTSVLPFGGNDALTRQQVTRTEETAVLTAASEEQKGRRSSTGAFAAILGLILVALGVVGYSGYKLYLNAGPAAAVRRSTAIETQRLTGDGKTRGAEISPDGKFLAYVRTELGERSLWLKQIQTNSNIPIVKSDEYEPSENVAFSPDGNFVYFNAQTKSAESPSVYRVPTLGGSPTKALTNAYNVQFSPDGRHVSFGRLDFAANETAIFIANVDGSDERKIASKTGKQFFDGPAVWSPDGRMVASRTGDDTLIPGKPEWISVVSVADGAVSSVGDTKFGGIDDLVWHPSGDSLIVVAADAPGSQTQLWEVSFPEGAVRRLTNNLNGHYSVSITADGESIVTGEIYSRSAIWVAPDLKPENAKPIMAASSDTWGFSWTPDGRIVYVSNQTGDTEVWIMDSDGSNAKSLTNDRIFKTVPVVSPDGRYIVYTNSAGGGELVRIDINGGNRLVINQGIGADNPDISSDSKWVLFSAWIDGMQKVLRVPIGGGEPQHLTTYRATEPRYSRDGTRIACFTPNEQTQVWSRLAIIPAEGGDPVKIFDAPANTNISRGPVWTHDDKGITLVVSPGELQNLWLQPVDGGVAKPMTNFGVPGVARRDYSRDGKRIAIVRAEGIGNAIMITDFR